MYNIFVYGTLKQGFPNFKANSGERLPGVFATKSLHALYLVGERNSPWLVADSEQGAQVTGQVFTVDEAGLKKMDALERIEQADGYSRVSIEVIGDNNQQLVAYAYLKLAEQLLKEQINSPILSEYSQADAAKYSSRKSA